jgi:hypothetical protein
MPCWKCNIQMKHLQHACETFATSWFSLSHPHKTFETLTWNIQNIGTLSMQHANKPEKRDVAQVGRRCKVNEEEHACWSCVATSCPAPPPPMRPLAARRLSSCARCAPPRAAGGRCPPLRLGPTRSSPRGASWPPARRSLLTSPRGSGKGGAAPPCYHLWRCAPAASSVRWEKNWLREKTGNGRVTRVDGEES